MEADLSIWRNARAENLPDLASLWRLLVMLQDDPTELSRRMNPLEKR